MKREVIFDTQCKNEYLLLKLLYFSSSEMKKVEICDTLGITLPTLSTMIISLKNKLQDTKLIFYVKRNTIQLGGIENTSLDELTDKLLETSYKYKMLNYLFFNKGKNNIQISEVLFTSETTTSRIKKECNNILSEYDLKINKGNIEGDITQYLYFYYLFFSISSSSSKMEMKSANKRIVSLTKQIQKKFELSLINLDKVHLWTFILIKELKSSEQITLSKREKENIQLIENTRLYIFLKDLYKNQFSPKNEEESNNFAYFMCIFFISFGIITYSQACLNLFKKDNPIFEITNKIMMLSRAYFKKDPDLFLTVENSLFSLLSQIFYFNGVNFFLDTVTSNYYKNIFNSSSRNLISTIIQEQVILPSKLFNEEKQVYLKNAMSIIFYTLSPDPKFKIRVGVASNSLSWLTPSTMKLLERNLNIEHDVKISTYNKNEFYDLVITDISSDILVKNYTICHQLTAYGVGIDIQKLSMEINRLMYQKYCSKSICDYLW